MNKNYTKAYMVQLPYPNIYLNTFYFFKKTDANIFIKDFHKQTDGKYAVASMEQIQITKILIYGEME